MKKTVCIVSAMYPPSVGGVERYSQHLARTLVQRGCRVVVLACNTHDAPAFEETEGIAVYRFPCHKLMNGRMPLNRKNADWRALMARLNGEAIDGFILQTRLYPLVLTFARYAAARRIPTLLIDHSSAHMQTGSRAVDFFANRYEHWLTKRIKQYPVRFFGVSAETCRWLGHYGIRAEGVFYNSIDVAAIEAIPAGGDIRREQDIPPGATIVLYVGRLIAEKGAGKLADAIQRLNAAGGNCWLLVAGDGPLRDELAARKSPQTRLLGSLNFPAVVALYRQADIFCLPTEYPEGFPTTLLEAAAARCFCITTDRGGARELISGDEYGMLLGAHVSVEELAEKIGQAAADPEYRTRAAEAAHKKVAETFTWHATADKICHALFGERPET